MQPTNNGKEINQDSNPGIIIILVLFKIKEQKNIQHVKQVTSCKEHISTEHTPDKIFKLNCVYCR